MNETDCERKVRVAEDEMKVILERFNDFLAATRHTISRPSESNHKDLATLHNSHKAINEKRLKTLPPNPAPNRPQLELDIERANHKQTMKRFNYYLKYVFRCMCQVVPQQGELNERQFRYVKDDRVIIDLIADVIGPKPTHMLEEINHHIDLNDEMACRGELK